jgi:hypothetical protein
MTRRFVTALKHVRQAFAHPVLLSPVTTVFSVMEPKVVMRYQDVRRVQRRARLTFVMKEPMQAPTTVARVRAKPIYGCRSMGCM